MANIGPYSPEDLKKAEKFFLQECGFVWGAENLVGLPPPTLPEVAFIGRSNVGKSSLINALVNRKKLARASNTPGRTQQINFFKLAETLHLVDLPGYGYAVASRTKVEAWNDFVRNYLIGRVTLRMTIVLVDSRHGLKDSDRETLAGLDSENIPAAVVLTKTDKPKYSELQKTIADVKAELEGVPVFAVSAETKDGLAEFRAFLASV